jgi:hypothetical protein
MYTICVCPKISYLFFQEERVENKDEHSAQSPVAVTQDPPVAIPPPSPLEQRTRKSDRQSLNTSAAAAAATESERDDLDFLNSLTRPGDVTEDAKLESLSEDRPVGSSGVVPVQIVAEKDKKELEDWLDDFLAD